MPLVITHSMGLSQAQKARIAEGILRLLDKEGIITDPAGITFAAAVTPWGPAVDLATGQPPLISPDFRTRARRTRAELTALRERLIESFQQHGTLSSLQARRQLGLTHCDWAPAALRRMFRELESQGLVVQLGLKRGTCYAWQGPKAS